MKTYYLHVSYKANVDDGSVWGDMLIRNYKGSLNALRELIKNDSKLEELPVIISLSELSKGLYERLLNETEDNEQDREDKSRD